MAQYIFAPSIIHFFQSFYDLVKSINILVADENVSKIHTHVDSLH